MADSLRIAFVASSLVSACWNGAATYYRGLARALHARGHRLTIYEPDAWDRQAHRDIPDPPWARVVAWDPADPGRRFLLGGAGWEGRSLPANMRAVGHVRTADDMALVCERVGADAEEVRRGVGADLPGIGYGRSCFPKDVSSATPTSTA